MSNESVIGFPTVPAVSSDERFRTLVELAPHAMVIVDAEGRIVLVNSQLLRWFGYAREELLGQSIELLIPERFRFRHPDFRRSYATSPTVRPMGTGRRLFGRRKDGSEFPVDISLSSMPTAEGLQLIASIADMTERERAEAVLQGTNHALALLNRELEAYRTRLEAEMTERRQTEQRFEQIFELAPHALVIVDQRGVIQLVNAQLLKWFGYTPEDLTGQSIEMLVPERFRGQHPHMRDGYMRAPTLRPMGTGRSLFGLRKDGSEFPVDISLSPLPGQDGTRVLAAIADMTDRVRGEEALRRLAAIVESSEDPIISKTLDGLVTSWNPAAERLFAYGADEMIGSQLTRIIPADKQEEEDRILSQLQQGERIDHYETARVRKDGARLDVSVTISPIKDDAGRVVGASKIVHDLSDRIYTENELRRTNTALELVNKELETFAYSVSHDLRQPVRALTGFTQILLDDYAPKLDDQGRDYLRRIQQAGQRMGQMIEALLGLSRISRGALSRGRLDISALAQEVLEEIRHGKPAFHPEMVIAPGMEADADPRLLRVLLQNLLGNAWKFSGAAATPRVEFGQTRSNGTDAFFVRDNGAGFDMAYADKLFGAFQRLHRANEFPGTGIGLATAQRIVLRHGGRIWAEGKVGAGATFYFTL